MAIGGVAISTNCQPNENILPDCAIVPRRVLVLNAHLMWLEHQSDRLGLGITIVAVVRACRRLDGVQCASRCDGHPRLCGLLGHAQTLASSHQQNDEVHVPELQQGHSAET